MTDGITGIGGAASSTAASPLKKKNDEIGQTEFLNLLVAQLKNQDPLEPMKNEDFAVNLAQFSQLERLISIDEALKKPESSSSASLASYLGYEVSFDSESIPVAGGEAGTVRFALPNDARQIDISLLDKNGVEADRIVLENVAAGRHSIELNNLRARNGDYTLRAQIVSERGEVTPLTVAPAGVVTGFVPGPEPRLLVGRREVNPANIREVAVPQSLFQPRVD